MLDKFLGFYKKNTIAILLVLLAIITFLLWLFAVNGIIVTIIFVGLFLLFLKLKLPRTSLIVLLFFSLFSFHGEVKLLEYQFRFALPYHVMSLLIGIVLTYDMIKNKRFVKGKLFWPMVFIATFALISVLWSPDKIISLGAVLLLVVGYSAYVFITNLKVDEKISLKNISFIATVLGSILAMQVLTIYVRHGFSTVIKVPNYVDEIWDNPNLFAALFAFLIPLSLYKYKAIKENKKVYAMIPFDLFVMMGMLLTQSRGMFFGFIVGLAFSVIIFKFKVKTTFIVFSCMLSIFFISTIIVIVLKDTYPSLYDAYDKYSTFRIRWYEIAYKNFMSSPLNALFGTGIKSSTYYISLINEPLKYYHSFVFQTIGTLGIVGSILYVLLFYRIYLIFKETNKENLIILMAIIMHLSHEMIDVGFEYQYLGVIFYILIAYVERREQPLLAQDNVECFTDIKKTA